MDYAEQCNKEWDRMHDEDEKRTAAINKWKDDNRQELKQRILKDDSYFVIRNGERIERKGVMVDIVNENAEAIAQILKDELLDPDPLADCLEWFDTYIEYILDVEAQEQAE